MEPIYPRKEYRKLYREIIAHNMKRERQILSKGATLSSEARRRKSEKLPDRLNLRSSFFHDIDRIIHCNAYARYRDKTQVFFRTKNDHITRRFLHVQMVAKISRTLARFLRVNEDLTEAIALAHDLGHAPFGHAGEAAIARILEEKGAGSFVHNAQSVRLLENLEQRGEGLNLSLQVLDGVLGHNGEIAMRRLRYSESTLEWSSIDENMRRCMTEPRSEQPDKKIQPSTVEGCLVRVSDLIAYLGRDVEDAIEIGVLRREDLPAEATALLGRTNKEIIGNLVMDVTQNSYGNDCIEFSEEAFEAMMQLKSFNSEHIYRAERIRQQEIRFGRIVQDLFDAYLDDLERGDENSHLLQAFLKDLSPHYRQETLPARIVADYISGMTDSFVLDQYVWRFMPEQIGYVVRVE